MCIITLNGSSIPTKTTYDSTCLLSPSREIRKILSMSGSGSGNRSKSDPFRRDSSESKSLRFDEGRPGTRSTREDPPSFQRGIPKKSGVERDLDLRSCHLHRQWGTDIVDLISKVEPRQREDH